MKFIQKNLSLLIIAFMVLVLCIGCKKESAFTINIQNTINSPQVLHGIDKLIDFSEKNTITIAKNKDALIIKTVLDSSALKPEAFSIRAHDNLVTVTGGDATGIMYGLLDIKEQLATGNRTIKNKEEVPNLAFRALKFNLPWEAYRSSKTLREHTQTCKDTLFWRDFLDMMAENRFNKLTLWNLHPFSRMVKTEKYPEACSLSDEEMKTWETLWHTLFRMAKDRGIETYMVNWNIFVSKEFAEHHKVSQISIKKETHVGVGDTSEIVKDYMRECVRATIDKYPDLTGLGITLGEGMGGMTAEKREKWVLETVVEGARQAKRKIKFIHRVPLSAGMGSGGSTDVSVERLTRRTLDTLTCFDGPINIELKFNWSHGHSTPKLVKVHGGELKDTYWNPMPKNYYLAWMIRNEDFFILRWGQPDFIRQHIAENVHPYVNGYYVGSETYIPAKDFITSLDGASAKYAFERQWMFYKVWGHLLYNPSTPDTYFIKAFENRFPNYGKDLFEGQSKASKVPLIIASYWNAKWDFTLYSEGMLGFNDGPPAVKLLSLKTLANRTPMDPRYVGVKEFIESGKNVAPGKITPIQLADSLNVFCNEALKIVEPIYPETDIDLLYEKSDIQAWAYLGLYFSDKLKSAVAYQQYVNTKNKVFHQEAILWLEKATKNWSKLVDVTKPVYQPVTIEHKGYRVDSNVFHWSIVQEEVEAELHWLKALDIKSIKELN
ncbi:hypothetical protein E1J38_001280 [Seonamhaeicola sediminis]|uniref:Beta-hexosaminidase bacterial type N-terminal domain-containing protein n=1 Tax=Seonamhaeicola sediminis TaxID=2528206 RepID=A0A562YHL7_9FLAO|nr:hypothetical protein [Seonamhaeicola sediminis]TWO34515.1 hypothetical protein E1J38_001280 [Seonamhaeicola sediminis]